MPMEPYIAEINIFAGNRTQPQYGFAHCQGQILNIQQNPALYAVIGNIYGGSYPTTFALPDCRGRKVIGAGQGAGLPDYAWGQKGGAVSVTLAANQMPIHNHTATGTLKVTTQKGSTNQPGGAYPAVLPPPNAIYKATTDNAVLASDAVQVTVAPSGGGQPFSVEEPYIAMHFQIAVEGIYPSRP